MPLIRRIGLTLFITAALALQGAVFGPIAAAQATEVAPVSYVESGNPQGIPVILIHAFPMNKSMWAPQVAALKQTARVITFDIRGLGQSPLDAPYTLEFVVDDLMALLDQLKIEKAVVCGLSMGGFVALRAVERNPERFKGLVLANTKSEADSDASKLGRYKALKTMREQGLVAYVDGFLKQAIAPITQTNKPQVLAQAQSVAHANRPAGVAAAVLALTSRTDTTQSLGQIQIPTLILHGELDAVIPVAAARSLHEKIKGSRLFLIPQAGHLSNLEDPETFNLQLMQFLKGL